MKFTAILLAIVLLFSVAIPAFAVETSGTDVPIIHIHGMGTWILNEEGKNVYTFDFPIDGIAAQVKECIPEFIEAMKLKPDDAWEFYRNRIREIVLPCFGPFFLDKNGEASDGTYADWDWKHGNLPDRKGSDGYKFHDYPFHFDWRLDPFVNAASLNDYIQDVKKATGSDKVNVCARCEGVNVLLAYFASFGYDDVKCAEFYASAGKGSDFVSALFSGKLHMDADAVRRFQEQNLPLEDEVTNELVDALLVFGDDTLLLDVAAFSIDVFNLVKVYDEVIAPIVLETYGTLPGIWSMVDAEDYSAARRGIFGGHEEEYAGLLEKLDHYDAAVRQRVDDIMLEARDAGVKVAVFAKYGDYQTPPLGKQCNSIGDGIVALSYASFGATVAKYGKTLSEKQRQATIDAGKGKYLSPDGMVDASTCIFPDTTWFFYNCPHSTFPAFLFDQLKKFFDADGNLTVFDDETLPQYSITHINEDNPGTGTLEPMTTENAPNFVVQSHTIHDVNWKEVLLRLLKAIWEFLKMWSAGR